MIELLPGVNSTVSALNAERIRMEVVSQNIANMETTRGPNGHPYQRQTVVFETVGGSMAATDCAGSAFTSDFPQAPTLVISRHAANTRVGRMIFLSSSVRVAR